MPLLVYIEHVVGSLANKIPHADACGGRRLGYLEKRPLTDGETWLFRQTCLEGGRYSCIYVSNVFGYPCISCFGAFTHSHISFCIPPFPLSFFDSYDACKVRLLRKTSSRIMFRIVNKGLELEGKGKPRLEDKGSGKVEHGSPSTKEKVLSPTVISTRD